MEKHPPLHLSVVAIEKGAFRSLMTKVTKYTYIPIKIRLSEKFCNIFVSASFLHIYQDIEVVQTMEGAQYALQLLH